MKKKQITEPQDWALPLLTYWAWLEKQATKSYTVPAPAVRKTKMHKCYTYAEGLGPSHTCSLFGGSVFGGPYGARVS